MKVEPATPTEIEMMADAMPPRLRASVIALAWCALRYGELAELRRKDIDAASDDPCPTGSDLPPGGPVVGLHRSRTPRPDVSILRA